MPIKTLPAEKFSYCQDPKCMWPKRPDNRGWNYLIKGLYRCDTCAERIRDEEENAKLELALGR